MSRPGPVRNAEEGAQTTGTITAVSQAVISNSGLNQLDARLLAELQADGRASYAHLAERVGLSPAAARVRVVRLLDDRVVRVVGIASPHLSGYQWAGIVALKIVGEAEATARSVASLPETSHVSVVSGQFDVIVELRCDSEEHLLETVDRVRTLEGVDASEVLTYLKIVKDAFSRQVGEALPVLDVIDKALIEQLERDGRATYADLAPRVGLSQPAVRTRVQRLIESGAVTIGTIVDPESLGLAEACGIGVKVVGSMLEASGTIATLPDIGFVAITAGRWDVIGTVICASRHELLGTLDTLRSFEFVRSVDVLTYLHVEKEEYPRISARRLGEVTSTGDGTTTTHVVDLPSHDGRTRPTNNTSVMGM